MKGKSVDLLMKAKRRLDPRAHTAWTEFHPFRSAEARAEYFASLEPRERRWPIPSEDRVVETSWARTFVRVGGLAGGPPLVLMHGAATNSLSWECNIQGLSERHRTYAIDNPYDVGRSVYARDASSVDDYVAWLDETLSALGLAGGIDLVGMSYGAWLTAKYTLAHPERVARAVLLVPALTVQNVRFVWVVRCLLSMLDRRLSQNFARWTLRDAYEQGPRSRQLVEEIADDGLALSKKCISRHVVLPTRLEDAEWRRLTTPMLVLVGEHEKHYHPAKAVAHLARVAPRVKVEVIAGAGHDLAAVFPELVNRKVLAFLEEGRADSR
ncbi:MAG TPA: alpha/beta hydrolase [Myxococcota bacterium]|nr:alpha/beta hydrolase [Myxococcota bacterium]HRY95911.1 alpha/beta hydrolase [Myxococcota bacterium]